MFHCLIQQGTLLFHPYEVLICGFAHPDNTAMDPWKQCFVMPQVIGTELLVAGMAQWLHFKPHIDSHF